MSRLHPANPAILLLDNEETATVVCYAWPGGYPMFYLTTADCVLCPGCVQDNLSECAGTAEPDDHDGQWFVCRAGINWEDSDMTCDECLKEIESAYGDADADADDEVSS